jgi:FMN-dependent NADH-azoreductase
MKLLHIDSSVLGDRSASRQLTAAIVAEFRTKYRDLDVNYVDLDRNAPAHLSGAMLARSDTAPAVESERRLQEFLAADVIVIGAPMYNFSIPSTLKAWVDRIAVAGRTFRYTATGPEGLTHGKRVIVAATRGGIDGPGTSTDFVEPYLRQLFGFLGVREISVIRADGLNLSPQHRAAGLSRAQAAIATLDGLAAAA